MTTVEAGSATHIERARRQFFDGLPAHFERLRLEPGSLTQLQTERLRRLLRVAMERSSFHRRRLAGIEPDSFTLADLASLPPMTKEEMMAGFDEVVTDPALHLEALHHHLETIVDTPALYLDRYVVLASGGSSGTRGVFVADIGEAAQHMAAVVRGGLAGMAAMTGWPPPGPAPISIVAAPTCVHATRGLSSIFLPGRLSNLVFAPVTDPFETVVDRVQRSQPLILIGYPSVIARLADAQRDDRLSIHPMVIAVTSEQLTEDHVARITEGFGVAPTNSYGTSEGLMGTAPPASDVFDFASDNVYVEFVDADDEPITTGQAADHILVTNLYNHTQPLIRYRIDDTMTPAPASRDHGHQRATLQGRNDEQLEIGGVVIHPLSIRSPLVAHAAVGDYQVRLNSDNSIDLDVVPSSDGIDLAGIEASVAAAIARTGAQPGHVRARIVDQLPRDPRTGKTRRFVTRPG